jgi:hypothetical protein
MVGDSSWSDQFTFLIVSKPQPPLNPQILQFDNTQISMSWEQPITAGGQAISGFKVYRENCSDAVCNFELLVTL